jgi:hypothetical protein
MCRTTVVVGLLLALAAASAVAQETMLVLDENVDEVLKWASQGAGTPSKSNDAFTGKESLFVGSTGADGQRYNPDVPGWGMKVVETPKAANEFRYVTFAWKKDGGEGIQLQISGTPADWGHRYHAGKNVRNWNPSIEVSTSIPAKWTVVTRDLFKDWQAFTVRGMAFTAWDGKGGLWDSVWFHKGPNAPTAVEPKGKAAVAWASLKSQ